MEDSKNQIIKEDQLTLKGNTLQWEKGALLLPQITRIWAGRPPKKISFSLPFFLLLFVAAAGAALSNIAVAVVFLAAIIGAGLWSMGARRENAVNVELLSGATCSFLVKRATFAVQACELILEYASRKENAENMEISIIRLGGDGDENENKNGSGGENGDENENENEEGGIPTKAEISEEKVGISEKLKELKLGNNVTNLTCMDLKRLYEYEKEKAAPNQSLLSLIRETIPAVEADNRQESKIKFAKFIETGLIQECNELGLNSLLKDIKSSIY